jgi:type 1 glutamine amidotransferase
MSLRLARVWLLAVVGWTASASSATEFKPIFDGKSFDGWIPSDLVNPDTGQPKNAQAAAWNGGGFWSIEDGAITARSTPDNPCKKNQFILWRGGQLDDFELKLKFRIDGQPNANSGVQVRSQILPDGHVVGYQCDIDKGGQWVGAVYDEHGRKMLADRGQRATVADGAKITVEKIGDKADLFKAMKSGDWNEYHITAVGNRLTVRLNGVVTSEVIDNDRKDRELSGFLAPQLHSGPPMTVQFKDIQLKRLPLSDGRKRVVMIAGKPSHPPGMHEHNAGVWLHSMLLNAAAGDRVLCSPYYNGWPTDPTAFDTADAVVMYSDGGERHMVMQNLSQVQALHERGVGVGAIHYAVEPILGDSQNAFLRWIGGAFEINWSVNPHWDAEFKSLPNHPISRGVAPFTVRDEWYYNMRFREGMQGVTGILSAVPTEETYSRPDGHHSGNPHVRAMKGQPTITMWASEPQKPGAGRGFGFTGGHFHANWGNESQRRVVHNAILWIAGAEVPSGGVATTVTDELLQKNLDDKARPAPKKKQ